MFEKDLENVHFVEPIAGGVRIRLPRRDLGNGRHFGWVLLGIGLFGCGFMAVWMGFPISIGLGLLREDELFGWLAIGFGLLGLLGLLPMLWALLFGLTMLTNRTQCTIDLNRDELVVRENLLLGSWKQKRPLEKIERLRIGPGLNRMSARAARGGSAKIESTAFEALGGEKQLALHASGMGMKAIKIAGGYPLELLEKVVQELAPRIEADIELRHLHEGGRDDSAPRKPLLVEQAPRLQQESNGLPEFYVPEQPAESTAMIERREGSVVINCPPLGVFKGAKGLWVFALCWNGLVGLFCAMLIGIPLGLVEGDSDTPLWLAALIMLPFVAIGVGLILGAIHIGKVQTSLATAGGRLLMARESIFGRKVQEWSAEDLEAIRLGASNTEVNNRPVMELQIQPLNGKKKGLLSERDDDEIAWIAAELTRALELHKRLGPGGVPPARRNDQGRLMLSHSSRLRVRHVGRGSTIEVPPGASSTWLTLVIVGAIFLAIAVGVMVAVIAKDGLGPAMFFVGLWSLGFGGTGLAMLLGGLVAMRRRFTVDISPQRLQIVRRGLFGTKRFEWPVEEVLAANVINSGTKVNNRVLKQVEIQAATGGVKLMTGYPPAELAYMTELIRETLGMEPPEIDSPEIDSPAGEETPERLKPW